MVRTIRSLVGHRAKIHTMECYFLFFVLCILLCVYCNGFDQRVARQQLSKHGPTRNNEGSCVFCGDVINNTDCLFYVVRATQQ
jgi:hypothetical protein